MKCAVIFYHKNIDKIYKPEWIQQCIESISNQSFQKFDCFELNYGEGDQNYCSELGEKSYFLMNKHENHIGAMNHLYDLCFKMGYDVVFNTNMDDFYHHDRFEKQIKAIEKGYQLVSSNFRYFFNGAYTKAFFYDSKDIKRELNRNHNVIAHPVIAMHKSFWGELRYKNILGSEDLILWKQAMNENKKFIILPEFLLSYRLHENQVTKKFKS